MKTDFAPDCARCAALCCLALDLDEGEMFAFDKPAGLPCRHLKHHSCTIHARLEDEGFPGCAAYTCLGAGQITVQEIFGGRSWRDQPDLTLPMIDAFAKLREIRDLAAQLTAARALDTDAETLAGIQALLTRLTPSRWTADLLGAIDLASVRAEFAGIVAGLRRALVGANGARDE